MYSNRVICCPTLIVLAHLQYKGGLEIYFARFISLRSYINQVYYTLRAVVYTQVTFTYNRPDYRHIYPAGTPVYDMRGGLISLWLYKRKQATGLKKCIYSTYSPQSP
jgi:hypothetical protein